MAAESKGKLKRIILHVHGHGTENEGFEAEHEYGQEGNGEYHPPKSMGVMKHHGEVMAHVHEHLKNMGSDDNEDGDCAMCGSKELKASNPKNITHHGYEKGSSGDPKVKHTSKHPGFKAVESKIASKEGLSQKAAGAILAARSRGASASAHKANPRLNRVK